VFVDRFHVRVAVASTDQRDHFGRITYCDLSGCTQRDRSCVELSRFAEDLLMRIPLSAKRAQGQFTKLRGGLAIRGDALWMPRGGAI
jgi:hypothetical protein